MADGTFEVATEVELTAQDLLALEPPVAITEPNARQSTASIVAPRSTKPAPPAAPVAASVNRWSTQHAAWAATLAIAVGIGFGAMQMGSAPARHVRTSIVSSIPQKPDPVVEDAEPTLARNPFDPSEVFELPPGMSAEDARAAVADLLMKRAADRQALIDTRRSRSR